MLHRFEQFTASISAIQRCIQKLERQEMEKYGCKGAYAQYLLALSRHPEGIRASQLSEICDINKAAVSRNLNEMEADGLIERIRKPTETAILLTDTGRKAVAYVQAQACAAVQAVGSSLPETERQTMYDSLEIISENLQELVKTGIPGPHSSHK